MVKKFRIRMSFSSLRARLLCLSLLLLIVPILILGTVAYEITKQQLETAGKEQLKQDVQHVLALIDEANKQVISGYVTLEAAQEMVKQEVLGPKGPDGKA